MLTSSVYKNITIVTFCQGENDDFFVFFIKFIEENPTIEEIQSWIDRGVELKKLFNTSGMLYRELNVKEKRETYTEEQLIELLSSNGMLVKRPIVIQGDTIIIGNKVSEYENLQK